MTFFSRQARMPMPRQQFGGPPPMARQPFGYPMQNAFPQSRDPYPPFYPQSPNSNGQWQQPYNPYQQMPNQGNRGLSDNLNTIMGHVGTVTNGINAMRQVGSLLGMFRI